MMPAYLLLQLIEELTGPPPIDDQSIAEESTWILNQLLNDCLVSSYRDEVGRAVTKEDIGNVLTMLHVHRLDVSALYYSYGHWIVLPVSGGWPNGLKFSEIFQYFEFKQIKSGFLRGQYVLLMYKK